MIKENSNFLLLLIVVALPFGSFNSIQILISNLFEPFGYTSSEIAFVALWLLLAGVLGALVIGSVVDKTHRFKHALYFTTFSGFSLILIAVYVLMYQPENQILLKAILMLFGFCYMGFIPLCLAFGAELTFPLKPALVQGTFTLAGSGSAFIYSAIGGLIFHSRKSDELLDETELLHTQRVRACTVFFLTSASCLVAFLISIFIEEDLRRLKYGAQKVSEEPVDEIKE